MKKTKKRASLLAALACLFALVFAFGLLSACAGTDSGADPDNGANTEAPATGGTWYYGASAPRDDLGADGDYYLDTSNLSSYVKSGAKWRMTTEGEAGSWFFGTAAPRAEVGEVNDFYLNTTSGELYQKQTAENWGSAILVLKGTPGRDGVIWFSGEKAPSEYEEGDTTLKDAAAGDFYLDYPEFDVYQLGKDGEWKKLGSLKGDEAPRGSLWFTGTAEPQDALLSDAREGDFYFRTFSDFSDRTGYEIYHYGGGAWRLLVDVSSKKAEAGPEPEKTDYYLTDLNSIKEFAATVSAGNKYSGKKIHISVEEKFDLGKTLVTLPRIDGDVYIEGVDKSSSILEGMLAIDTAGAVTAENVTFQAETGSGAGKESNFVLNVNAGNGLAMTDCVVRRTTGEAIATGVLLNVVGNATLENCSVIAPVAGTEDDIHSASPSTIAVSGELEMTGGSISTNGYAFFDTHVKNATLNGVTLCGLTGEYEGVKVKSLYLAINNVNMENFTLTGCTIKDCRDWAILAGGDSLTVEDCTFENNADQGIVLGATFAQIKNVTLTGNDFSLAKGMYPVVFIGATTDETKIISNGNKVGGETSEFELGFLAQNEELLENVLNYLTAAHTESIQDRILVGLQGTNFELKEGLSVNAPLTLRGVTGQEKITTNLASGKLLTVTAQNVTVENIDFELTNDQANGFAFVMVQNNGFTAKDCTFTGKFDVHSNDGKVTRAIEFQSGNSGYLFEGNTFTNVRQPSYLEGTGTVKDNTVEGTKGFVVADQYKVTFTGNRFSDNAEDIAVVHTNSTVDAEHPCVNVYTIADAIEMSQNNSNAYVDIQPLGVFVRGAEEGVTVEVKGFGGTGSVSGSQAFLNTLAYVNTLKNTKNMTPITVRLYEGTYTPTAGELFRIEADNIHLVGEDLNEDGSCKTVIDAGAFVCSGQAGFEISGDNCSVKNIKFMSSSEDGAVSALKITKLDNETTIVENFTLTNAEIEGKAGHALNLHGVNNVTVDNVKIGNHGKCGISIAKATKVLIKNTEFTVASGWANDVGFMYKEGNAYSIPCDVTIDFTSCKFARNLISSERPTSAPSGVDKIYNGTSLESREEISSSSAPAGWTFGSSDAGWALTKQA